MHERDTGSIRGGSIRGDELAEAGGTPPGDAEPDGPRGKGLA